MNRRRWWIHLVLISGYVLLGAAIGWGRRGVHVPAFTRTYRGLLFVCAVEMLIFALVFGLALVASRASRDDLLLRWRGGFWPVPLGIGYSVALRLWLGILMASVFMSLVVTHLMTPESFQEFIAANRPKIGALVDLSAMRHDPVYFWLTLTLVSFVLGGLREELWRAGFLAGLRVLWPQAFGSQAGQLAAVAIGAAIFGFGHFALGPLGACMAGLLGFGLGTIMVLHRSIWSAVIAHGMFDATSLALLPWLTENWYQAHLTLWHG